MRAALLEAANQPFVIDDSVKIDDPGRGHVRVKVSHCGICHSDLTVAHGAMRDADRARARSRGRGRRGGGGRHDPRARRFGGAHADRAVRSLLLLRARRRGALREQPRCAHQHVRRRHDRAFTERRHGLPRARCRWVRRVRAHQRDRRDSCARRHAARRRVRHRVRGADRRRRGAEHRAGRARCDGPRPRPRRHRPVRRAGRARRRCRPDHRQRSDPRASRSRAEAGRDGRDRPRQRRCRERRAWHHRGRSRLRVRVRGHAPRWRRSASRRRGPAA